MKNTFEVAQLTELTVRFTLELFIRLKLKKVNQSLLEQPCSKLQSRIILQIFYDCKT